MKIKTKQAQRVKALLAHRAVLLDYLRVKMVAEDWHGVSDAANDLREIDAELRARNKK